jgi:hypothetical protein
MDQAGKAPNSALVSQWEPSHGLNGFVAAAATATVAPVPSDRLYQVAAMTAGIFLLATLL